MGRYDAILAKHNVVDVLPSGGTGTVDLSSNGNGNGKAATAGKAPTAGKASKPPAPAVASDVVLSSSESESEMDVAIRTARSRPLPTSSRTRTRPASGGVPGRRVPPLQRRLHALSISLKGPEWDDEEESVGAHGTPGQAAAAAASDRRSRADPPRILDLRRDAMRARMLRNKAAREQLEEQSQ